MELTPEAKIWLHLKTQWNLLEFNGRIKDFRGQNMVQWLSMVWDKIPMIGDVIDLANNSSDLHFDLTKFDYHENSNAGDTKK